MSITPRKELELDTLWLLKMIESELIDHPKNNKIKFPFNNPKVTFSETGEKPSYDRQKTIIDDLEIQKVLEFKTEERHVIYTIPTLPPPLTSEERHDPLYSFKNYASGEEVVPKQNYLIVNKKKFEEVYADYQKQQLEDGKEGKTKQKFTSKIEVLDNCLYFGEEKIPVERGQKLMTQLFLGNSKTFYGKILSKNGKPVKIEELQLTGGYKDEGSFRDGLKKLRRKLKKSKWPVSIDNIITGKYQMVIKYSKKNKTQEQ